jgi:hypothetical protein
MLSQRWVNIPWALLLPYKFLRWLIIMTDRGDANKKLILFMQSWYKLIKHIGQRKYLYWNQGNEILGGAPETDQSNRHGRIRKTVMYLPTDLNYQYDERTFRNLYLAKDKPLKANVFKSLIIDNSPENMKRYLKSLEPRTFDEAIKRNILRRTDKKQKKDDKKAKDAA